VAHLVQDGVHKFVPESFPNLGSRLAPPSKVAGSADLYKPCPVGHTSMQASLLHRLYNSDVICLLASFDSAGLCLKHAGLRRRRDPEAVEP
jgi:hypothetical protein